MGTHPLMDHGLDQRGGLGKHTMVLSLGKTKLTSWQVALVATNSLLSSQLIVGCISLMHHVYTATSLLLASILTHQQDYVAKRWHQFLIYIGLTVGAFVINAFGNAILPLLYRGACMLMP